MQHLFLDYELSKKAKELGFDEPCFGRWKNDKDDGPAYDDIVRLEPFVINDNSNDCVLKNWNVHNYKGYIISAPLYQQIVNWLREKHNIHITIQANTNGVKFSSYDCTLFGVKKRYIKSFSCIDYYQALTKAIETSFKIIEDENN